MKGSPLGRAPANAGERGMKALSVSPDGEPPLPQGEANKKRLSFQREEDTDAS